MTTNQPTGGPLVEWYQSRIGEPGTDDEAQGYWLFALGIIMGLAGILLFLGSQPAGSIRQWAILLASGGFVLLLAGPIIRLPLRRSATWLVYLGVVICAVAIAWFTTAFPQAWSPQSGQPQIIGLYALGVFVMAIGGVFVPVLTAGPERDEELQQLGAERDLARESQADSEADEADLAPKLRAIRSSNAQFELYADNREEWRWRLRHRNGNLIADSGEGYTRRHNAQKGMQSVRRNAFGATVLLIESEAVLPEVGTDDGFVFPTVTESQASFELYEDSADQHRWRLRHENGNIIADSGQGYASRQGVEGAIDGIREYVGPADYLRPDPTAFEIYQDRAAEWRWRLVHRNGNILADSGEGYSNRSGAQRAINRIRDGLDDLAFEVYTDTSGEYRWRLRGSNNQIMADSGEGYESQAGVEEAVERVKAHGPEAHVLDVGRAVFEVYEDQAGEFRWRLRHRNGNILADGGQGYSDRSGTWDAIASVKANSPGADIEIPVEEPAA